MWMLSPRFRSRAFALIVCAVVWWPRVAAGQPPADAVATLNRVGADLFSQTPRAERAIGELKALIAEHPGVAEAHMLLGVAYRVQGAPEMLGEAVAELRQALALKPDLVQARLILARLYMDMSRAQRAREELEFALEQMPAHPQLLSLLGEAERQLGNPKRGVELNRQALEAGAGFTQARYYLGLALLDLQQHEQAVQELQRVAESGENPAEANTALGRALVEAGRLKEASATFRRAIEADPSRADAHLQLARVLRVQGSLADADRQLTLALQAGEDGMGALYQSLKPENHMEEGILRTQQGRLQAAAEAFGRVLALDPNHEPAQRGLAEVRRRMQQRARPRKPVAPA